MPRKTKQPTSSGPASAAPPATTFASVIKEALEQYHAPDWLGEHSPLAAPYFLGDRLSKPTATAHHNAQLRGQAVQQLLREAADEFLTKRYKRWSQGQVWHELLHASYFKPQARPDYVIIQELHVGEAAYYRNKQHAIEYLAQEVIDKVKPALRLESISPPATLVGRTAELAHLLTALQAGQSVGLTGPGGVGKTTLGQALAQHFASATTFWYTFVPGLTDGLRSLLFALAWFLHQQGASTLWSQLVADRGEIKAGKEGVAFNLLRHDLASLKGQPVLLCFDEVDLLRSDEYEAHAHLLPLLESLRGQVALLYIGQKSLVATDVLSALSGLTSDDSARLLQAAGLELTPAELTDLYDATQGNPRLLELFSALAHAQQRAGATPAEAIMRALRDFAQTPAVEFLLRRIWLHLNPSEQYLLELLAVFRNPVPRSAWPEEAPQAAIDQLLAWRLAHDNEQGEIQLLPALRTAIYHQLPIADEKNRLHLEAALVRSQYGQFAAAAYHYGASGESVLAVELLYTYKETIIDQGQAEAALAILLPLPSDLPDQATQEKRTLLQAELQKLLGQYDTARQTLRSIYWRVPFLSAQRWRLEGDIAELRGEVSQARSAYQTGLELVEKLLSATAYFHRDLGYLYTNAVAFAQAQHEVGRLRHEAANLEGFIHENHGDLPSAAAAYQLAFQLAQSAGYAYGEANAHNNLGRIWGWQREIVLAEAHLQKAITFFQNTGRRNKQASATYNLALARRLARQYTAALAPAQEAFAWFQQLDEEYGQAVALELLAEIYLGLNNLEQAEHYVSRVLVQEHSLTWPDGLRTLGEIRLQQGKPTAAEQLIQQSLTVAQAQQNRVFEAYAWRSLSRVAAARNNLLTAQAHLAQAVEIFQELGLPAEIAESQI